jgi:hypothetical protein
MCVLWYEENKLGLYAYVSDFVTHAASET